MMQRMQRLSQMILSYSDSQHVLDALEDALLELEENELVSQALIDKLTSAREIMDDGSN